MDGAVHFCRAASDMARAVNLGPTAGLRSLACLGVTSAHMVHFAAWAAADKAALYASWAEHRWIGLFLHTAEPGMDSFMVLTGYNCVQQSM